jgi:hypothetical protein
VSSAFEVAAAAIGEPLHRAGLLAILVEFDPALSDLHAIPP